MLVLDADDPSWQRSAHGGRPVRAARAATWSWSPTDDPGLDDFDVDDCWFNVSEAKHRLWGEKAWLLVAASEGLTAMVSYPEGRARWAAKLPGNVHSTEVLPDGNVAVAASTGGFVRLYTASQSARSTGYTQYSLAGAHGLHWDQDRAVLWALGDEHLVALGVGGSSRQPKLTLQRSVLLPSSGGHDLTAVAADPDRLWATTDDHVYQYSIRDSAFVSYVGQDEIDGRGVKSVGDDPFNGQVLTVSPQDDNPCEWCTSTIRLSLPRGSEHIPGSSLYKARWMPPGR